MTASAATYCTWPDSSSEKAFLRLSVVVMAPWSNSLVTAQALFEDTCAAMEGFEAFVGTAVFDAVENRATAVGRYASDFQNVVSVSDLSMPMTMSTRPSESAPSGSAPTSTISSFKPKLSAKAAAMSTSTPTILPESESCPASGALSAFTPTRSVPSFPMTGDESVGALSGGA